MCIYVYIDIFIEIYVCNCLGDTGATAIALAALDSTSLPSVNLQPNTLLYIYIEIWISMYGNLNFLSIYKYIYTSDANTIALAVLDSTSLLNVNLQVNNLSMYRYIEK